MKQRVITSKQLRERLSRLNPGALLSRRTWRRVITPEQPKKALPRLSIAGTTGKVADVAGVTSIRMDDLIEFPDMPAAGADGAGRWIIPPVTYYATNTQEGRMATLDGATLYASVAIEGPTDQAPFLLGNTTAVGDWADFVTPYWELLPADNPELELPTVGPGESGLRVLISLASATSGYNRRPFRYGRF